ncbi:hypothetical protein, partial [Arthrobacter sp. A2-55]|uniref:hypothetical protein n=1 Tax=Arthrobacter sp. A2-55 TaxID=2897337 RepID=UPI0021CDA6D7
RYATTLDSGHIVTVDWVMPYAHRVSDGGEVRPIRVTVERSGKDTKRMSPKIQAEIDTLVERIVKRENQAMARSGISPIHVADLARYRDEFGYGQVPLPRLVESLHLEREYGLAMTAAWAIAEDYIPRDQHEEALDFVRREVTDLESKLEDAEGAVAEIDEEAMKRAELITEAVEGLRIHGRTLLEFRPGNSTVEQVIDYLEEVAA